MCTGKAYMGYKMSEIKEGALGHISPDCSSGDAIFLLDQLLVTVLSPWIHIKGTPFIISNALDTHITFICRQNSFLLTKDIEPG